MPQRPRPVHSATGGTRAADPPPSRLDLQGLEESVRFYFSKGLASSTQRTCKSGKSRYLKFCTKASVIPLPVCEKHLCSFVAYLAKEGLKFRTIKVYLSAVRHMQIEAAMPDPFKGSPMARLEYVTRGIKKHEAEMKVGQRPRLPITPPLLLKMRTVWEPTPGNSHNTKMLWAASCLCFFAFMRARELTVPAEGAYDPSVHLSVGDVAVDDTKRPTLVRVTVKQSKTDPFRRGVDLFVGRTRSLLCPVAAVLDFLCVRGTCPGALFVWADGRPLTRSRFAVEVRSALSQAGVDQSQYCTHSFILARLQRRRQKALRIQSSKPWADGRVRHTCSTCASPGAS